LRKKLQDKVSFRSSNQFWCRAWENLEVEEEK